MDLTAEQYEELINRVLIEQIPQTERKDAAHKEIASLFGGEEGFQKLPILDIGEREGGTGYIDFIDPSEMTAPIMRGVDKYNREFFVIRAKNNTTGEHSCTCYFERAGDQPGTWATGLKSGFKLFSFDEFTLDLRGQHLAGDKKFELLRSFIESKKFGEWSIE